MLRRKAVHARWGCCRSRLPRPNCCHSPSTLTTAIDTPSVAQEVRCSELRASLREAESRCSELTGQLMAGAGEAGASKEQAAEHMRRLRDAARRAEELDMQAGACEAPDVGMLARVRGTVTLRALRALALCVRRATRAPCDACLRPPTLPRGHLHGP